VTPGAPWALGPGCEKDDDDDKDAVSTNDAPTVVRNDNDEERCALSYVDPVNLYYSQSNTRDLWNSSLGVNAVDGAVNYVFTVYGGSESGSNGMVEYVLTGESPVHMHEIYLEGLHYISVYAEDASGCRTKTLTQGFNVVPDPPWPTVPPPSSP
jgi:hypothetical protein